MGIGSLQTKKVAILGYGNQGRAHALNLRDSGIQVVVGARPDGKACSLAQEDGFEVMPFSQACQAAEVVMFLLPDHLIPSAMRDLATELEREKKWIGFAHGFAVHFGGAPRFENCGFFLVAPKGAGTILRSRYLSGEGLPTCYAALGGDEATKNLALEYARAIAGGTKFLRETSFQLETEGDLFGEQVVLVGGLMELMRGAFETLVANGHPPELAFFDVCQELQVTVDLFLKNGPVELARKISPTALYGAATRGPRVVSAESREQMQKIFEEVRNGAFAKELLSEFQKGAPSLSLAREKDAGSLWQRTFEKVRDYF